MHSPSLENHGYHTLDSLYPQARKLQFELKMQMSYLESGRTGGKTDTELQAEARENLSTLEQLLWQLDSLVQRSIKPMEKDTWMKKLQQLRNETHVLGSTLEQHIYSVSRRTVEARERERLLNRSFDSGNGAMYAAQESESLHRSSQMVSDLTSLSQSILGDLGEQRNRMKNVRTKLLDIANRLGLSSSLLRVIERRDTVDYWIVIGGMVVTLGFLRSPSRNRSRERSRRAHRHSRNYRHHRSRSRSPDHRKRRKCDNENNRLRRHLHSRSASKSRTKWQNESKKEKKEVTVTLVSSRDSKLDKEEETEKLVVDMHKKLVTDSVEKEAEIVPKVVVQEKKVKETTVEKEEPTNGALRVDSVEQQKVLMDETSFPCASKPVMDVSSIKKDILKALADARSTIAVIKNSGAGDHATTFQASASALGSMKVEAEQQDQKVTSPTKQTIEMAGSSRFSKTTVSAEGKTDSGYPADEFDMFSMAALDDHDGAMEGTSGVAAITVDEVLLQSNRDDAEGYYFTTIGEILNGKYRVLGVVGKGVFSTVVRCQCITPLGIAGSKALNVVAIKIIRNNDIMRDAAQTELKLLNELRERDPRDKKHCIRLLESFSHRNHVAMVFEPMQMNVREAMKKFGGKGGISIQAVSVFSKHLLMALNHLETCGVIHADIKPDNILLDEKQTTIKLCDFGSAFKSDDGKQDPTPYLVSRFYRAPEIVLGLAYDKAVDMWSVGCCLYEMFTGKVMFPGSTNNEMLKLFMELKGKIPNKLIKKHRQVYIDQLEMEPHFTEDLKFCSRESDRVTGKPILRLMDTLKAKSDLASSLMAAKSTTDDRKLVLELRNLLDRMFTLDPLKRISVRDALAHSFVKRGQEVKTPR
ncbi:unnamed protein product [Peronospora belbahrii]|uniref:non-specific serine/threonine protein kinase n=1 Tax=Peronospora belbahrii TaxID=622444 RepID=A0AAU9KX26_9STRA|nr:unnamed protein product [Peronospora belbahrii]CAH0521577.1 unnamed protein product [Peronospora belbahrii]